MPVYYNSQKIIPAPFVQITKRYDRSPTGQKFNTSFDLIITGSLVAFKGSPDSAGDLWTTSGEPPDDVVILGDPNQRLKAILKKQEGLRELFSEDGKSFEIQPLDATAPLKCNPIVNSIEFGQGTWYDLCQYTIQLEANVLYTTDGTLITEDSELTKYITDANESWSIAFNEDNNVFSVTHSVSATGKTHYNESGTLTEAWSNAKSYILSLIGSSTITSFLSSITTVTTSGYSPYNYVREDQCDKVNGTFQVSETWVLSKQNYIEEYTVSIENSAENPRKTASIQGTITGTFTNYTDTSTRYDTALAAFNALDIYSRVLAIAGFSLNAVVLSSSVGHNEIAGTINYNYSYDDRPSNILGGSVVFESVEVVENRQQDVFVAIPVIGRTKGPILQSMNAKTERSRVANIEVRVSGIQTFTSKPNIQPILDLIEPDVDNTITKLFVGPDVESWDWKRGIYTRNITWTYENA